MPKAPEPAGGGCAAQEPHTPLKALPRWLLLPFPAQNRNIGGPAQSPPQPDWDGVPTLPVP